MVLASLDLATAFDFLTVQVASATLGRLGVDAELRYGLIENSVGNEAAFHFEGVSADTPPRASCVKTGFKERPDLWTALSLVMFGDLTSVWARDAVGVRLSKEAGGIIVSLFVWADNLLLTAADRPTMAAMISQLTWVLHDHGFRWKPSSLEFLDVGATSGVTEPLFVTLFPHGIPREPSANLPASFIMPQVDEIVVLGTLIARRFNDHLCTFAHGKGSACLLA